MSDHPHATPVLPAVARTALVWAGFEWAMGAAELPELTQRFGLPEAALRPLIGADAGQRDLAVFFAWLTADPALKRAWDELNDV